MFRAQPMSHVRLWLLTSEAADAALLLARHGLFAPLADAGERVPQTPVQHYRELFQEADARLNKILAACRALGSDSENRPRRDQFSTISPGNSRTIAQEMGEKWAGAVGLQPEIPKADRLLEHCGGEMPAIPADAVAPNLAELGELNDWLKEVWQTCSATSLAEQQIDEEKKRLSALRETFARLETLDLDLSRLLRPDSLLDARLGQVPTGNVHRLKESLGLAGYVLSVFERHEGQAFAVIAGPRGGESGMGGVLTQAGWRDLPVPEALQGHPEAVRKFLAQESERLESSHAAHCQAISDNLARFGDRVFAARVQLALARPLAEAAASGVGGKGQLSLFTGWVPRNALADLKAALEQRFHGRYLVDARNPRPGEHVPSLLRYPAWLSPFVPLVKSYGIPRYGEFDPALIFALSYLLLFGAMFGDVGHGGVILVLAALFHRKLGRMAWLGIAAGAASMVFGVLYGSIFGYEDILEPVWISPLHDPIRVLSVAILFGVGFIVYTLLANIANKLSAGHTHEALFDSTGLAGLVFYLGAASGLAGQAGVEAVAGTASASWWAAGVGILAVAVFKWVETRAAIGERALVTAIETLETGINLFANTLSFMRVAAFSLNHVALALAVFTIAAGLGTAGHWITILLGNVIIIVLEGGIVAIQALRLMYYEGFSRFFSGDGTEFVPLRLREHGR